MAGKLTVLSNEALRIAVASLGAEMQYLRTAAGDDVLWHGDPAHWSGRAPVLFPIVGRAPDDTIAVGAHKASMSQHGFARRRTFDFMDASEAECHHVLSASEETRAVYPFDFVLHVTHALDGNTLTVAARIENQGAAPMPFSFGFHPAFCWPLPKADGKEHYVTLASGGSPQRRMLMDGLLAKDLSAGPFDGGTLLIEDAVFADGALVFPNASEPLRYGSKGGPGLTFQFENLPDLAVWRPVGAPFVCIEPWHGTAALVGDGPNIADRPNAIMLAPGKSEVFGYSVSVEV